MKNLRLSGIILAIGAALLYALSIPFSKLLLPHSSPTMMAAFLYLGAGLGIGVLSLIRIKEEKKQKHLAKSDLPYVFGMIVLDIAAPILLMFGLNSSASASTSLLNNLEIVITALVASLFFKEKISWRLWISIGLIFLASSVLTFDGTNNFQVSWGSLLVLGATCCWGLENNLTRKMSNKSSSQIVIIKGLCSGSGSLLVALIIGEQFPQIQFIGLIMLLGFIAYGLSIFFYVLAQRYIGAAKTSVFYAITPFASFLLSLIVLREQLNWWFFIALGIMLIGSGFVVFDTLSARHDHMHKGVVTYEENGTTREKRK